MREEFALRLVCFFRALARLAQLTRLLLEFPDRVARHANRRGSAGPPPLRSPGGEGNVETEREDEDDLGEKDICRDRPFVDEHDPRFHQTVAERAEDDERQASSKGRQNLIGGAREQNEEEPALLRTGKV